MKNGRVLSGDLKAVTLLICMGWELRGIAMADMMPVQSKVPTEPFSDVREIRKGVGTRVLASDPPHLY